MEKPSSASFSTAVLAAGAVLALLAACGGSSATGPSSPHGGAPAAGGAAASSGAPTSGGAVGGSPSSGGAPDAVDCDPRKILCRRVAPTCPGEQVPSVEDTCFGPCVDIDQCACSEAEACPEEERFTCHQFRNRCGPYLR